MERGERVDRSAAAVVGVGEVLSARSSWKRD
jgi:hypothetical protein